MRQYATSKFRLLVLIAMMTAAVITATSSFAQDAPPGRWRRCRGPRRRRGRQRGG